MAQFQLGSISTGTLKTEDLLPAFIGAITALGGTLPDDPGYPVDRKFIQELENTLQELCPPFVYFGALEGDGADFGFWPDMDRLHEAMMDAGMALMEDDEEVLQDDGVIVHITDHGNVTVMDMERNVIWSTV